MGKSLATTCSRSKTQVRSYQMSQLFFDLSYVTNTELKFFEVILFKDSPRKQYICIQK